MNLKRTVAVVLLAAAAFTLFSCGNDEHCAEYYLAENRTSSDFDLREYLGISFSGAELSLEEKKPEIKKQNTGNSANFDGKTSGNVMRVYGGMKIYSKIGDGKVKDTLREGTIVYLTETEEDKSWCEVKNTDRTIIGYTNEGYMKAIDDDCGMYAELPIEYGDARTNSGTMVHAYSNLVDVRKYFKTLETYETDFSRIDLRDVELVISMKLATNETTIGEPFYNRNLCMLQYDVLPMLRKAVEMFKKEGCTVIIYDAYRPTSVQQKWFDVVKVHKWVADPSIGMGGVHDRGTAMDISLIGPDGKLLEMPTPMHTFTEASARNSASMTAMARKNMDYMKDVMVACGFSYINSEWWHFQDKNTQYYLPTDHPIDDIPLIVSEKK